MRKLTHCPLCHTPVNEQTVKALHVETLVERPPQPDPKDEEAMHEWLQFPVALHCKNRHPLAPRVLEADTVVMALVGTSRAGKSSMLAHLVEECENAALSGRGVGAPVIPTEFIKRFNAIYGQELLDATPAGTRKEPHLATVLQMNVWQGEGRPSRPVDVMVFDAGGENIKDIEAGGEGAEAFRSRTPFIPASDVIVYALSPDGLALAGTDLQASDQREKARQWAQQVAAYVADATRFKLAGPEHRVTVVALTKADRYRSQDTFELPDVLLKPRKLRGDLPQSMAQTMADEQETLFRFIHAAGGQVILEELSTISGPVFLTATSGVSGDDRPGVAFAEPAVGLGSNRVLDPLLIALMRAGLGKFAAGRGR